MNRLCSFRQLWNFCILLLVLGWVVTASPQQVQVVDVIPALYSNETTSDSEPNVTVNPANPNQVALSAFTPCPPAISNTYAPIYISTDGGTTWQLNCIVPGNNGTFGTGDITLRFAGASGVLYAGILLGNSYLEMNILRTADFTSASPMTALVDRTKEDQPYTQAMTAGGDHVYVGNNDRVNFGTTGKTSTVDLSLDASTAPAPAGFVPNPNPIEVRTTCAQDLPSTRPAIHPNGTIYVAYLRPTAGCTWFAGSINTTDITVARDDNWGSGGSPFTSLIDGDGQSGVRVATGQQIVWVANLGTERIGSQLSIAVDPSNSQTVYLVWAEGAAANNYTLHVRRSIDGGSTWSADLKTVVPATNPALAINKDGIVGFLYQKFVNPGTCNGGAAGVGCWETHFETYDGTTWTDLPHPLANVPDNAGGFPLGDYDHVLAVGSDFYGAFSANNYPDTVNFYPGVQYQRIADFGTHKLYADAGHTTLVNPSVDPFFFHVTELAVSQDFYVRDWTDNATSHDNGEEPSTNPNWWTTGDVWNRLTNTNGGFNANDQPNHQDAQDAMSGHNYAFVRIHRKAAAPAGSPDVNVTARFLYADYGLGVPYKDVSASPTATLTFAAAETAKTLADGAGVQWDLPATRSTHICLAVEISTPADHYSPELAGRAPGWPTTDWTLPADNDKAQKNMDLPMAAQGGGLMFASAVIHNAATFTRTMTVRYQVSPNILRKLEGGQIGFVGADSQALRESGTLEISRMVPGENRWLNLSYSAPNAKLGETLPVSFEEVVDGAAVNGLTIAIRPSPLDVVIRENLKLHRATFNRLDKVFGISKASQESSAASKVLGQPTITAPDYLNFLKQNLPATTSILSELLKSQHVDDSFSTVQTLNQLEAAVSSEEPGLAANNHAAFLNQLDSFQTMLQKSGGDPDDILQMVTWQRELYMKVLALKDLKVAKHVVQESDEFIRAYGKSAAHGDTYPELIRELLRSFHDTAESLEKFNLRLEPAVDEMEDHLKSLASLEKAHRTYLLKLDSLPK